MTELQQAQENVNTVFELFAHHRRRYALRGLWMHDCPMSLSELAREVTMRETETPITALPDETVTKVHQSLYHTHIPKLVAADFVQYDQEREIVSLTERVEHVEEYQELLTAK